MRETAVHDTIEPLLIDYAAGTLGAEIRRNVESHLDECAECRRTLAEWQHIAAAARADAGERALPPLDWQSIRAADAPLPARPRVPHAARPRARAMSVMLFTVLAAVAFLAALAVRSQNLPTAAPFFYPRFDETRAPVTTEARPGLPSPQFNVLIPPETTLESGTVLVVIAIQDIPHRKAINTADVALQRWNTDGLPEGAFTSLDDVLGKIPLADIRRGELVRRDTVTGNPDDLLPSPHPDRAVVVAARPIALGAVIQADDIDVREWPVGMKPPGAISDPAEVIGKIALADFANGMAITRPMVAAPFVPGYLPDLTPAP